MSCTYCSEATRQLWHVGQILNATGDWQIPKCIPLSQQPFGVCHLARNTTPLHEQSNLQTPISKMWKVYKTWHFKTVFRVQLKHLEIQT